jgi:HAD superfamily hydrolase (TIGR01484 family)
MTDYDGTFTDPDSPDEPLTEALNALRDLAEVVPVAVVTTKECAYVEGKVPFAKAYACVNGIELKAGGYVAVAEDLRSWALEAMRARLEALGAQLKRTSRGELAGAAIDWRRRPGPPEGLAEVLAEAERLGLSVVKYSGHPFVDIYASKKNKGDAVRALRALLGVNYVVYIGDSENDVPAWLAADVRIVVRHKYNKALDLEGLVPIPQEGLAAYLREVVKGLRAGAPPRM